MNSEQLNIAGSRLLSIGQRGRIKKKMATISRTPDKAPRIAREEIVQF
jgi:hypothetical protein